MLWLHMEMLLMSTHKTGFCGEINCRYLFGWKKHLISYGPVVQSVISLTSSLRAILLTILADSISNFLKFFAEKMWVAFALQKLLTFFQQKNSEYLCITQFKF